MIRFVSSALTAWLVREKAILTKDTQLYAYAVYSLIWGLLPVIISLLLGVLFGLVIESLVLVLTFILLRKFSGGFHLSRKLHFLIIHPIYVVEGIFYARCGTNGYKHRYTDTIYR